MTIPLIQSRVSCGITLRGDWNGFVSLKSERGDALYPVAFILPTTITF